MATKEGEEAEAAKTNAATLSLLPLGNDGETE
jgi:hypothetical protein